MPLSSGQVLNNRYRIQSLLGQGGFGFVYQAWDLNLNMPVAVKELSSDSPLADQQFAQEARRLASLRNPHLPYVVDHFTLSEQGQYLVMEYVDGQDLQSLLKQTGGGLPEGQVLTWMQTVLTAVEYLHTQSPPVIHRDIKPANILVPALPVGGKISSQGRVMLVDYGIARAADPSRQATAIMGTPEQAFIPPEQNEGLTDVRSDVYSIGATLYNLLTGQLPPPGLRRQLGKALIAPRQLNSAITPNTEAVILEAMQLEPDFRFQSVAALRAALGASSAPQVQPQVQPPVRAPIPLSWHSREPTERVPQPASVYEPEYLDEPPRRSNRMWIWVALAVLGLCLLGGLVVGVAGYFLFAAPGADLSWPFGDRETPVANQTQTAQAIEPGDTATFTALPETPASPASPTPTLTPFATSTMPILVPSDTLPAPPTAGPSDTPAPRPTWLPCTGTAPSRLYVGDRAMVGYNPPLPNRVRAQPNTQADIVGLLQPGETMDILEGPVCSNQWVWWRVRSLTSNLSGWTAEGDLQSYWLVPAP